MHRAPPARAAGGHRRPGAWPRAAARGSRAARARARRRPSRSCRRAARRSPCGASSTVPCDGRSMLKALNSAVMPFAARIPANRPTIDAPSPMMSASSSTERRICRREAPIVRSSAELGRALRDRDREGVEDDERADEQRDPGEREQQRVEEAEAALDVVRLVLRVLRARLHVDRPRQQAAQLARHRFACSAPLGDRDVDLVQLAALLADSLRLGQREDRDRRSAERGHVAELRRAPRSGSASPGSFAPTSTVSPTLKCVLVGGARVERRPRSRSPAAGPRRR